MTASPHTNDKAVKPPLLAFVSGADDIDALKAFAGHHEWADDGIHQGDIRTAAQFLKSHTSPVLLIVEIPSAAEAPSLLDALAEVCDPDTKVITIGDVNEYSFYCWLMDLGIFSYLLKPLTTQALEGAWAKAHEQPAAAAAGKQPGKAIAVIGARGGVGASTIALNLGGIIASNSKKSIVLADTDAQEGSIALMLDIEPSRGFRDALERPDRMDSLFIERVMSKPLKNLSVLSAEESLQDLLHIHEQAADTLLRELRNNFSIVLLDIPRHQAAFHRACLKQADQVVLVTELTLLSLRDAMRLSDVMRESLKIKPPIIVANRVGMAAKQEIQPMDFEKGVGIKIAHSIPFAPDIFMQVSPEIPAAKQKTHAAVKPLYALAATLAPETKGKAEPEKKSFNLFKKAAKG